MCLNYYILNTMIFMILLQEKKSSIDISKKLILFSQFHNF